jgi:aminoglycoside/choline kinase family phosphotransferase
MIEERLTALYRRAFGCAPSAMRALRGDGSDRRIMRLDGHSGSAIGIWGENIRENRAFLGFTRVFAACGLAVPALYAVDEDERCYLEEDLGDTLLFDWQAERREGDEFPPEVFAMYARVLRELPRFQIDAAEQIDYGLCYQYPEFGEEAIRFDLRYFREMFLEQLFPEYEEAALERDFSALTGMLLASERRAFLYRDFQSRNVMITGGAPRFIDYQSGRRGALQYDVASLLYDAKARIPEVHRRALIDGYIEEVARRAPVDRAEFLRHFDAYALVRVLQALGAFGNLGLRKRKPGFLSSIPPALDNAVLLSARHPLAASVPALADVLVRARASSSLLARTLEPSSEIPRS